MYSFFENLTDEDIQGIKLHEPKNFLTIGLPKETNVNEHRVALCPEQVESLTTAGYTIVMEKNYGIHARFEDDLFINAGAKVVSSLQEVYDCDIVVSVAKFNDEELGYVRPNQIIFSGLDLDVNDKEYIQKLSDKKATVFCYDLFTDKNGIPTFARSVSEIVGNYTMLIAAHHMAEKHGMILGSATGIPPTEVVIIGTGTVSEYVARTMLAIGANIHVFGFDYHKIRRFQENVGHRVYASIIHKNALEKAISSANVLIGAIYSAYGKSPIVVSEEMVKKMPKNSMVIDVSANQGGCIETTQKTNIHNPTFVKHGITHYCIPNIASMVPKSSSMVISSLIYPILRKLASPQSLNKKLLYNQTIQSGVLMYNGILTNQTVSARYQVPYQNLKLLLNNTVENN